MKKNTKEKIPQLLRITGLIIIFLGIVTVFVLPPKMEPIAMYVIIAGILIDVIPYLISNRVYMCQSVKRSLKGHIIKKFYR